MSPDRTLLVAVFVGLVAFAAGSLLRADGASWPAALLGALGAGGAALWGLPNWFAHREEAAANRQHRTERNHKRK